MTNGPKDFAIFLNTLLASSHFVISAFFRDCTSATILSLIIIYIFTKRIIRFLRHCQRPLHNSRRCGCFTLPMRRISEMTFVLSILNRMLQFRKSFVKIFSLYHAALNSTFWQQFLVHFWAFTFHVYILSSPRLKFFIFFYFYFFFCII